MADKDEIRLFVVGDIQTNCYAYVSAGECLVVDPGASGARIAEELADVKVTQIVATHRHHDHVGGIKALADATGAPWAISAEDAELAVRSIEVSSHDLSFAIGDLANPPEPDRLLSEGDVVEVGTARFEVLAAPGHTPGGIVLLGHGSAEGVAFVGDTIFAGGCGRCDLMGGDWGMMSKTLARLSRLIDPSVTLLCGHGPATRMGYEVATNPYMQPGVERESWSD